MTTKQTCTFCFGVPAAKDQMLQHALECESHPLKEAVAACQNVVDRIDEMSAQVPPGDDPEKVLRSMPMAEFVSMYELCKGVLDLVKLPRPEPEPEPVVAAEEPKTE